MRVSAKAIYACRAILELSSNYPSERPVHLETIAKRQEIPLKYLSQLIVQLREAGLVTSRRGIHGGHWLGRSPLEISLGDVLRAVEGTLVTNEQTFGKQGMMAHDDPVARIFDRFQEAVETAADELTFDQLLKTPEKAHDIEEVLSYA